MPIIPKSCIRTFIQSWGGCQGNLEMPIVRENGFFNLFGKIMWWVAAAGMGQTVFPMQADTLRAGSWIACARVGLVNLQLFNDRLGAGY